MSGFGVLTGIILLPLVGVVFILCLRGNDEATLNNARWAALATTIVNFLLTCWIWANFDKGASGFQFVETHTWFGSGLNLKLGVDGLSFPFVVLTTFLMPFCIAASWRSIEYRFKEYLVAFLLLETLMVGVFCALDLILFYLFFEGALIPAFIIIGVWGHARKVYAAFKFFLFTLTGSLLMLPAVLAMYAYTGSTDITVLLKTHFPAAMQTWLWLGFFASFAVKIPKWPFHTWLIDAHVEAPTAGSMVLAGVILKFGGYGFLRFSLPMFPQACHLFAPFIFALSVVAIIYTSLTALVQKDMKRVIAYSSIAHMGFVTLGIFSFTLIGVQGAVFQMVSHGLVSAALFFGVGAIYDRLHTRDIDAMGGIVNRMPLYATAMLILSMANCGLPGTSGFLGEFMSLLGTFQVNSLAVLFATTGVILSAAYALFLYKNVVFGVLNKERLKSLVDLDWRESAVFGCLVSLVIFYGFHPSPVLDTSAPAVAGIVSATQGVATAAVNPKRLAEAGSLQ